MLRIGEAARKAGLFPHTLRYLEEIREILRLRDAGREPCEQVKAWLDEKIRNIEAQIRALEELHAELVALRSRPPAAGDSACCPLLEARPPADRAASRDARGDRQGGGGRG